MKIHDLIRSLTAGVAMTLTAAATAAPATAASPVVVELFTSQGCSSCPPADALLGELAQRPDVLPLAFHVDYWNGLGWRDTLSSAAWTERQREYTGLLRTTAYTPQMVVGGRSVLVGSRRGDALDAIREHAQAGNAAAVTLAREGTQLRGRIAPAQSGATAQPARLLLVSFDPQVEQRIRAGENGGRTIRYHNVVRSLRVLDEGGTAAREFTATRRADERGAKLAVLLQLASGHIAGAAVAP